jgi:hypothetical protein
MILRSTDSSIVSDIAYTYPASPIPGEGWVLGLGGVGWRRNQSFKEYMLRRPHTFMHLHLVLPGDRKDGFAYRILCSTANFVVPLANPVTDK